MPKLYIKNGEWSKVFAFFPTLTKDGWVWFTEFEKRHCWYFSPDAVGVAGRFVERRKIMAVDSQSAPG